MKIDRRRNYLIGLDTETCNAYMDKNGKLNLNDSLVYDIGWVVTDKHGTIYRQRSFVVKEVFFGMSDIMTSAYYANKIPKYLEDIANGKREVKSIWEIRKILKADMEEFNTKIVFAHNARFDNNVLKNTVRYLSGSACRYFFPYNTIIWDTLKMSKDIFGNRKTYKDFCLKNGYMTKHKTPQCRFTAEILYRYLTLNTQFSESHTGLEDVLIETEILRNCFKAHKKMTKTLY